MEHFRGVSCCPHETAHGRSYERITGIMYAQTHIHAPRYKLIVARFCILINSIFTYLFSWNKPVHEIMVPIAYASSEGSAEPAHPWKIASALTAHIHIEGMWLHVLISGNIAPLSGCEFKNSKVKSLRWSRHLRIRFIYHMSVDACTPTLLHTKISLRTAQS